jgi:flagellar motor switch protein FliG
MFDKPRPVQQRGGKAALLKMLNHMAQSDAERMLLLIEQSDAELANWLRENLLSLDDIAGLPVRSLEILFSELDTELLVTALRGLSSGVTERLLAGVSKRHKARILEDFAHSDKKSRSEVEQAQRQLLDTARRLSAEGKIGLGAEPLIG